MGQGAIGTGILIGRDAEYAEARAALRRGGGVLLVGPAGVGKTALARALQNDNQRVRPAPLDPNTVDREWLIATATGPTIPFGAFGPLVPQVGGRPATLTGPRPDPASFDLLQTVRRAVLARAGERDLVLVVDDAHRLDEASATLVFQLVSSGEAA